MRKFRILLASVMLVASVLWLALGAAAPSVMKISEFSQIIPSAILSCLGTSVFWLVASLFFGRVYCATVCPLGTLQDLSVWLRRKTNKGFAFRYEEGRSIRFPILIAYLVSIVAGVLAVGYLLEPWNIMRDAAAAIRPQTIDSTWDALFSGKSMLALAVGSASGVLSIVVILIWAWRGGRRFCNVVCPIGTALGALHSQTMMHIAIDPDKCISCMKCEDVCSSRCINVVGRQVDNSRCVRCFDCIDVCPNDAIRFQVNRNHHRQTPLLDPTAK